MNQLIGKGSFGKVYMVQKMPNNEIFAMKVIKKSMVSSRNQVAHTKAERDIMASIKCPFIVDMKYAFQTAEKLYFVMEFLNGGELFHHLRRERKFSEERARFYSAQIIIALECLHKNDIIYRDLKPENIVMESTGYVKLTDFGLSKLGMEYGKGKTHTFCGTPEYLAPEIIEKKGHDKAVDWWSLGILVYEMLAGLPPFNSNNKQLLLHLIGKVQMRSHFSENAKDLLQKLLKHNPAERMGSSINDAKEIKSHPFYQSINWEALCSKQIVPAFIPKVKCISDVSHIDPSFINETSKETPVSNEINGNTFKGFTYNEEAIRIGEELSTQNNLLNIKT